MSSAKPTSHSSESSSPHWGVMALALAVVLGLLWFHALVLAPFVLSLALAYVLEPLVNRLVAARLHRTAAAAVCVLSALLLMFVLFLLLVPIVIELAPRLQAQLPDLASRGWHALVPWLGQVGIKVPAELSDLRPMLIKLFNSHGEQWTRAALSSLRVGGSWLLTLLGLSVLVPVLAFYWLLDWDRLTQSARSLVPARWRDGVNTFLAEADEVLGHYLRGQILVMLALALFYSIGLWLFGFELAWPIGVFTGLAVFIPYLGFGLGLVLALTSGLLQYAADPGGAWWPLVAVGVVYGLGQLIESLFLTPRLVGERIGMHPAGVIFVLMLFGQWLGFVGVLMALPVSAVAMVLLRQGLNRYRQSALYLNKA